MNLNPITARQALNWAAGLKDGLGEPLDERILRPVAALRFLDVATTQSCQGHIDWGLPYPWIDIQPDDMPHLMACLEDWPLKGYSVCDGQRIMPDLAAQVDSYAVQAKTCPGTERDPEVRERLIEQLKDNQRIIGHWAKRILAAHKS